MKRSDRRRYAGTTAPAIHWPIDHLSLDIFVEMDRHTARGDLVINVDPYSQQITSIDVVSRPTDAPAAPHTEDGMPRPPRCSPYSGTANRHLVGCGIRNQACSLAVAVVVSAAPEYITAHPPVRRCRVGTGGRCDGMTNLRRQTHPTPAS